MRDQVTDRGLDIVDTARTFAVLDASIADAAIACWRAKYDFNFWRPDTAIALADTDGNPATDVVAGWTPLIPNPPYPDYTSGHACVTGATTGTLENLFGTTTQPRLRRALTGRHTEPAVHRHHRAGRRDDERPHLARHPLPHRDDRRQRPRPRRRRLRRRQPLPAQRLNKPPERHHHGGRQAPSPPKGATAERPDPLGNRGPPLVANPSTPGGVKDESVR